jgi:hypothetical protein
MNKKQLIVAWIIGILVCLTLFLVPKKYCFHAQEGSKLYFDDPTGYNYLETVLRWEEIVPTSLTILIIGSLTIYSLRDKQSR